MHNSVIVGRIKELLNRARYALETRQWALLRSMRRMIWALFKLRHCSTREAIQRLSA